jgi:hypothetical protein
MLPKVFGLVVGTTPVPIIIFSMIDAQETIIEPTS